MLAELLSAWVRSETIGNVNALGAAESAPSRPALGGSAGPPTARTWAFSPLSSPWCWITRECSCSPGFPSIFSAWRSPPAPPPAPRTPTPHPVSPLALSPGALVPTMAREVHGRTIGCVSRSETTSLPRPRQVSRASRWRERTLHRIPWCRAHVNWSSVSGSRGRTKPRELTRPKGLVYSLCSWLESRTLQKDLP